MEQSSKPTPARPGGEFFADPNHPTQRRYEALRAYLLEGRTATETADTFGYNPQSVQTMARDFRAGRRDFFTTPKPGPKHAPATQAA